MSSTMFAQQAYAANAPVRTPRDTEYTAFQKVTAMMTRASRGGASMKERATALHDNRRLWTILATDLASQDNGLPPALKARMMYLAEFSLLQSSRALRDPAAISALIEVNTAVMRGLSGDRITS